jgi:serine/threonine-protein kinase
VTTSSTPEQSEELARFAAALEGQYAIEREIGRGGMGIVYLARDLKLDRLVAIKTLPPHLAGDPVVRERFLREARTAGKLSHQNIVPIHRADELDGRVFFVMGLVDGESMAQRVRERGRIDPPEVLRELRDVASALGYAHSHGVIHRDVKAENILIDGRTGRAMVTDFGIARLAEAAPLTSTGQVLGTVYYTSPEQVTGEAVDARSDIYSLGVAGYFALAGRFPFDADLASAVMVAHVTKSAPPLHSVAPHVPRVLADLIDRCLAKSPDDRPQDCDELADALLAMESLVTTESIALAPKALPMEKPSPLISDTEAQSILGRAADLQAKTGIELRPAPIAARRDSTRDAARRDGFKPADIRDAAVEAGISAKYVDHVLEEHGLAPGAPLETRPPMLVDKSKPRSEIAGGPMQIEYEIVLDGEMPEGDFDLLVDLVRHQTGEAGQIASVGRSFSWQTQQSKRALSVSVLARGGKTTIRVSESMKGLAVGLFGPLMCGLGGGSLGAWIGAAAKVHDPILFFVGWGGTLLLAYITARGFFARGTRKKDKQIQEIAEAVANLARESIESSSKRLPPSGRHR